MSAPTRQRLREYVAAAIRAELGWQRSNPTQLARKLGWAQSYMQRRVDGRVAIDMDDLETIADALGVSVTKLLPREDAGNTLRYRRLAEQVNPSGVARPPHVVDVRNPSSGRPRLLRGLAGATA